MHAAHTELSTAPTEEELVPAGHESQLSLSGRPNVPARQAVHPNKHNTASVASQSMGKEGRDAPAEPGPLYVPARQERHVDGESAPMAEEEVPPGQGTQAVPSALAYAPAGQAVHAKSEQLLLSSCAAG